MNKVSKLSECIVQISLVPSEIEILIFGLEALEVGRGRLTGDAAVLEMQLRRCTNFRDVDFYLLTVNVEGVGVLKDAVSLAKPKADFKFGPVDGADLLSGLNYKLNFADFKLSGQTQGTESW